MSTTLWYVSNSVCVFLETCPFHFFELLLSEKNTHFSDRYWNAIQMMCNRTNYGLEKCERENWKWPQTTGSANKVKAIINFSAKKKQFEAIVRAAIRIWVHYSGFWQRKGGKNERFWLTKSWTSPTVFFLYDVLYRWVFSLSFFLSLILGTTWFWLNFFMLMSLNETNFNLHCLSQNLSDTWCLNTFDHTIKM